MILKQFVAIDCGRVERWYEQPLCAHVTVFVEQLAERHVPFDVHIATEILVHWLRCVRLGFADAGNAWSDVFHFLIFVGLSVRCDEGR